MTIEFLLPFTVTITGTIVCIRYWLKSRSILSQLEKVQVKLVEILRPNTKMDVETVELIGEPLSLSPLFSYAWREFSETLIERKGKDGITLVSNSRPFAEFRTRERFLETELRVSNYRIWPGLLTAFGLFCSFALIQRGLGFINPEDPSGSINHFVTELKSKFYSSLAGILFAGVAQYTIEHFTKKVETQYNSIVDLIESKFPRSKTEDYLAPLVSHVSELTENMKLFTTSLATTIGNGVRDGMAITTDRMLDAVQDLHSVIEQLQKQSQQNGTELIQKLLQEMNDTYKGNAQKELDGLGGVIRGLSTSLGESTSQTGIMLDKMQGVLNTIESTMARQQSFSEENMGSMQSAMIKILDQQQQTSIAQSSAVKSSVDDIMEKTKSFSGELSNQFSELMKRNQETLSAFEATRQGLLQAVSGFQGAVTSTEGLLIKSNSIFSDLTTAAKTALNCQTELSKDLQILVREGTSMQNSQTKNQEILTQFQGVFGETEQVLSKLIREVSNHLESYHHQTKEQLENHLAQFAKHMGDATVKLSGTITDLDEHLQGLEEAFTIVSSMKA